MRLITAYNRSGAFRPIAVTTARRTSALPEVPTMQEAGIADYDLGIWFGLFVATRTPAPVVARLQEALARTRTEQTTERLRGALVDPLEIPREDLSRWVAAGSARWQQIAREARITAD